jgi:hypothetical protein
VVAQSYTRSNHRERRDHDGFGHTTGYATSPIRGTTTLAHDVATLLCSG